MENYLKQIQLSNNMKTALLVFGNEFLKEDNFAIKISKEIKLPNTEIIRCYSVGDMFKIQGYDKVFILDVVKNIKEVTLITDLDKIKDKKIFSMHDFDLGFNLKLLKEVNQINDINIIGIPQQGDKESIKKEIKEIVEKV